MHKRIILTLMAAVCFFTFAQTAFADTDIPIDSTVLYADVDSQNEHYKAIAALTERGIIQGDEDGDFNGDEPATYAMIWTMLARQAGVDTSLGDMWYSAGQEWIIENGISDGENPTEQAKYAQCADMLYHCAIYEDKVIEDLTWDAMTKWFNANGFDYEEDSYLTRYDAAELIYDFGEYTDSLTYEEFASELCKLFGIEKTDEKTSSIYIAIINGLMDIETAKNGGETLQYMRYSTVPTWYVLETIDQLTTQSAEETSEQPAVQSNETDDEDELVYEAAGLNLGEPNTQSTCDSEDTIEQLTEALSGSTNETATANLSSYFIIEEGSLYDTDNHRYLNPFMDVLLHNLDRIPQFVLSTFIDKGWVLIITDNPAGYESVQGSVSMTASGMCSYKNKIIAIRSGYDSFCHEFSHYISHTVSNGFDPINSFTIALQNAYNSEASAFAEEFGSYYEKNSHELIAEMGSILMIGDEEEIAVAQEVAPKTYELALYMLDEANWPLQ